ncbi:DNA translocase FtsK [Treponema sp. TIM-1]|uniref:DNA translocase FtsK n=1 Tax=Treponema sp. TIM-1 TaxID=2898417 RepID=UPI00398011FD
MAGALGLGVFSLWLGFSVAVSFFNLAEVPALPVDFLTDAYGFLSFGIPLYLLGAALLLADPRYRPNRIFILNAGVFPFFTLALGFAFIRDFVDYADRIPFLASLGKTGFCFLVISLTFIEGLIIMALVSLLFPLPVPDQRPAARTGRAGSTQGLLPPPKGTINAGYSEAAFLTEGSGQTQSPPQTDKLLGFSDSAPRYGMETRHLVKDEVKKFDAYIEEPDFFEDFQPLEPVNEIFPDEAEDEPEYVDDEAPEEVSPYGKGAWVEEAEPKENLNGRRETKIGKLNKRLPYQVPVEGILNQYPDGQYWIIDQGTRDAAITLKETLEEFKIQAEVTGIRKGPVITMFEILPAPGVKLSRIVNLQDNIALRLAASSVRIVAPIPGKHAVGIEVPNKKRNIVSFREIIEGELRREGKKPEIPVVLGKDITGEAQTVDLVQMPHLLIAGSTGSGKSVCVNSMILSILYQRAPAECRLILIDPKIVELKLYNDIPHLLTPVITEPKRAFQALQYCIYEMERRYACLDSMGVRDIRSYNKRIKERGIAAEHLPYIVVVIDEFADLMATTGKELESTVARLAAMSRAVGIHLVLATQRPSIDVITGLIKANIPSRIAFMVASKMDSRIIIDLVGAEKLLGKGDMLYAGVVDPFPVRIQGAFVSEEEVERVVEFVKTLGAPDYIDDEIFYDEDDEAAPSLFSEGDDPLYDKALEVVVQQGKASASYIQRRLKIGYNRAARLVEEMERRGVVGAAQGSKPRELLRGV